jgi:hypothetical protein
VFLPSKGDGSFEFGIGLDSAFILDDNVSALPLSIDANHAFLVVSPNISPLIQPLTNSSYYLFTARGLVEALLSEP